MRIIDADKLPYIKAPIAPILAGDKVVWCDIVYKLHIDNAPTVEAEPIKHGRWIDRGSGQECSVCGEIQYGYDSYRNYCANCGADMREVEE